MTREEFKKAMEEQAKLICDPMGCKLELDGWSDKEIRIKMTCPPLDVFKVQGKIVTMEDELKKKMASRLALAANGAEIRFV